MQLIAKIHPSLQNRLLEKLRSISAPLGEKWLSAVNVGMNGFFP
jgi:hypothetical protein